MADTESRPSSFSRTQSVGCKSNNISQDGGCLPSVLLFVVGVPGQLDRVHLQHTNQLSIRYALLGNFFPSVDKLKSSSQSCSGSLQTLPPDFPSSSLFLQCTIQHSQVQDLFCFAGAGLF